MIMNFKEAYKNMTDEIDTNNELLASIIEKTSEEKHKIVIFKKPYLAAFAAGLAAVVAIGFFGKMYFGFYNTEVKTDDSFVAYDLKDKNEARKMPSAGNTDIVSSEKQDKDTFSPDEVSVPDNEVAPSENPDSLKESRMALPPDSGNEQFSDDAEYDVGSYSLKPYDVAMNVPETIQDNSTDIETDANAEKSETTKEERIISAGGGGGSGAATAANNSVSIGEYWEYIGYDVLSGIVLPYDINLFIPSSAVIQKQDNEVLYDTLSVYGKSPDGKHSVRIDISKKASFGTKFSIANKGVYIGICSDTLTDEEISNILSSFK